MGIKFAAAFAALIGSGAVAAQAETFTFGEAGVSYENYSQGGSALNSGGFFPNEPEQFYGGRLSTQFGAVHDGGLAWGVQGSYLKTSVGDEIAPGEDSDEGVKDAAEIILNFGRYADQSYLGAIAGVGQVRFTADDWDQDTTYSLIGFGAGAENGAWAFGGSLVFMNVLSADNPETLDNAVLAKLQAEYALVDDQTFAGIYLSYANGENDVDSLFGVDSVRGPGIGLYARHKIGQWGAQNDVLLNAGIEYQKLSEQHFFGDESISSLKAFFGVSITFGGAAEPRAIRMATAPNSQFVQMMTPYVD